MLRINLATCAGVAALGAAFLAGCGNQTNLMAERAMMGGNVRYDENGDMYRWYQYYPNEQVYRSVYHYTWYWQQGESWHHGPTLPADRSVGSHKVLVELPTARPFHMHNQVAAEYPSSDTLYARLAEQESEMLYEAVAGVPTD